jgi:hypothetical protein
MHVWKVVVHSIAAPRGPNKNKTMEGIDKSIRDVMFALFFVIQ